MDGFGFASILQSFDDETLENEMHYAITWSVLSK
jgi:hypothetical protein